MDTRKADRGRDQVIHQEGGWRAETEPVPGHGSHMIRDAQPSQAGPIAKDKVVPQIGTSGIPRQNGAWWAGFYVAVE